MMQIASERPAPEAHPSPQLLRSWRNALCVTFGLTGLLLFSWLSRIPSVRDDLNASSSQMGAILFGIALGSVLGLLVASALLAKFGTRTVLAASITACALFLPVAALGTFMTEDSLVFAGLILFGIGTGIADIANNVNGAANERALGRTVMTLFHAMFSLGSLIGVGIGALAGATATPVLAHMSITCIAALPLLILAVRHLRPEQTETPRGSPEAPLSRRERFAIWHSPRTLALGVIVLGAAFAEGSAGDWLALAMIDGHGADNATGSITLGIFIVMVLVGRLIGGRLIDRFGRVSMMRTTALTAAVGLAAVIFVPNVIAAMIGVLLWGLGASLGFPMVMSAAADHPRRASERVSAVAAIGYLAFLAGPPVLGFLGDQVGLLQALVLVLALVVVAGISASALREPLQNE